MRPPRGPWERAQRASEAAIPTERCVAKGVIVQVGSLFAVQVSRWRCAKNTTSSRVPTIDPAMAP